MVAAGTTSTPATVRCCCMSSEVRTTFQVHLVTGIRTTAHAFGAAVIGMQLVDE